MSNTIPEGWKISNIDKTCNILDSKRVPVNSEERSRRKGHYPYYGANGIQGFIDGFIFEGEHILLAEDGGNFDQWESRPISYLVNGRFWVNNHAHILKAKGDNETRFLHYCLVHKNITKHINGGTRSKLNQSDMRDIEFVLPPLPEQQKIASILSSVDKVIETTRAQIDKLKDLKTGMMQELLTKGIGVNGVPHTEFKDSPVGRIPAMWEVYSANDLTEAIMVGVVIRPTQYYVETGIPALRSANVRENGLTMNNLKYFSKETNEKLNKSKLKKGDLLTVRTGYPGTTAVVSDEFQGCNCIDVVITRPLAIIDSDFFALWVNSDNGKGQVLKAQGGLAQQHFNVGDMKNLLVAVPSLEEQRAIFKTVSSTASKIHQTEQRFNHLTKLKKALMQDLLTGKVRVKIDDKEKEPAVA